MADALAIKLIARFDRLRTDKSPWDTQCDAIRRVIYPSGAPFGKTEQPGANTHATLYDTTGELALDAATDGLHSMLTNPATDWLDLELDGIRIDDPAGEYLENLERHVLHNVFSDAASGFYMAIPSIYREDIAFGNACLFVGDLPGRVPSFQAVPFSQVFWAENFNGAVDTFFRCLPLSARAAAERFGDRLPDEVKRDAAAPERQENTSDYVHCVYPRSGVEPEEGRRAADPRKRTYASFWLHLGSKTVLDERGYGVLPYMAVRNNPRPGEAYGRGPGAKTYPDANTLQRQEKANIRTLEKMADPPMMVADDGLKSRPSLVAGSYTVVRAEYMYDGRLPIRPMVSGARPDLNQDNAELRRQRIREAFLARIMNLPRDPKMTATQFLGLQEEQLRALSPWIGRYEHQLLGPLIERVLDIEARRRTLPPPPPQLQHAPYRARFVSPVARLQRVAQLRAIMQLFEVMHSFGVVMAAQVPGADKIKPDAVWDEARDTLGVTRRIFLKPDELKKAREAADKLAQQRAELEAAKEGSVVPKNLAPFLDVIRGGRGGEADAGAAPAAEAA